MALSFLIVEDETTLRRALGRFLKNEGHEVAEAADGETALRLLEGRAVEVALVDLRLPGISGIDVLRRVKEREPNVAVILMTACNDIQPAVTAMKEGAYDYVKKPFDPADILRLAQNAAGAYAIRYELAQLQAGQSRRFKYLFPESVKMQEIFALVARISSTPSTPVLISGETGTGKEVIAREIHARSDRATRPFVAVNCSALSESLLESELFGHTQGAFTDARKEKKGLFEAADGGTLFLDEIGDMRPAIQPKILRALEERTVRRVGGVSDINVDVRILAATNRDLQLLIAEGSFREDLYYRLNVINLQIPPLRERPEDIVPLARYFVQLFNAEFKRSIAGLAPAAEAVLKSYPWPGNVRELRNVVERAVILTEGLLISAGALALTAGGVAGPARVTMDESERRHILAVLESTHGNRTEAARILKISRTTLWAKLKEYAAARA
jgi:DNA-binding NtrC family response regulator